MTFLKLDKLTLFYGGISAANQVDLTIERGELHCLIGPNGAGKSTLFNLIMGLIRPQSGRILLGERDITRYHPFQRVRLGVSMKFQATRVFGGLTVGQNLHIATSRGSRDDDIFHWSQKRLGLADKISAKASELSYGQQHWLEMCMILGNGPSIVLMDEPTAGMTVEETYETAGFLRELNQKGVTIIVIEHDMGFIKEIAQRVTVLHQGSIFQQGTISEIQNDPEVQRIYLGESHD